MVGACSTWPQSLVGLWWVAGLYLGLMQICAAMCGACTHLALTVGSGAVQ